jgi:hypothetical protein
MTGCVLPDIRGVGMRNGRLAVHDLMACCSPCVRVSEGAAPAGMMI